MENRIESDLENHFNQVKPILGLYDIRMESTEYNSLVNAVEMVLHFDFSKTNEQEFKNHYLIILKSYNDFKSERMTSDLDLKYSGKNNSLVVDEPINKSNPLDKTIDFILKVIAECKKIEFKYKLDIESDLMKYVGEPLLGSNSGDIFETSNTLQNVTPKKIIEGQIKGLRKMKNDLLPEVFELEKQQMLDIIFNHIKDINSLTELGILLDWSYAGTLRRMGDERINKILDKLNYFDQ